MSRQTALPHARPSSATAIYKNCSFAGGKSPGLPHPLGNPPPVLEGQALEPEPVGILRDSSLGGGVAEGLRQLFFFCVAAGRPQYRVRVAGTWGVAGG
jgi:hypothetical protein